MDDEFSFIGGLPCLDFANSKGRLQQWHAAGDIGELLNWSLVAGTISAEEVGLLRAAAAQSTKDAGRTLKRATELSVLLCRIFSTLAERGRPRATDLDSLNSELADVMTRVRIVSEGGDLKWGWSEREVGLSRVLWPIVRSAADLLVSDEVIQVKICANDECRWVFLDTSRNHRRRWCDMKVCGNRAKVRRFRARTV